MVGKSPRPWVVGSLPHGWTLWLINGGGPHHVSKSWDDPSSTLYPLSTVFLKKLGDLPTMYHQPLTSHDPPSRYQQLFNTEVVAEQVAHGRTVVVREVRCPAVRLVKWTDRLRLVKVSPGNIPPDLGKPSVYLRWFFSNIFFMFIPIWGRFPFWLIFFKGVETTRPWKTICLS